MFIKEREVRYLTSELNVSREQLEQAEKTVGVVTEGVRNYLKK